MAKLKTKKEFKEDDAFEAAELAVDIYETKNEFIVESPIAGISKKDLDIFVDKGMLVIKGQRENYKVEDNKNYLYKECYWGKFSRKIILPDYVESSEIEAELKNGLLVIRFPKEKEEKQIEEKVEIKE